MSGVFLKINHVCTAWLVKRSDIKYFPLHVFPICDGRDIIIPQTTYKRDIHDSVINFDGRLETKGIYLI